MKRATRFSFLAFVVLALPCLLPRPAAATSYQMMSDQALADQARAIVDVRVVASAPALLGRGEPATDYQVDVERVVKGSLPGSTVVVRVPGGVRADGMGLKIWGAPQFQEGERALLFLSPAQDGTYRLLHLMLGAFHLRTAGSQGLALRDLSEASQVVPEGQTAAVEQVRDFARFSDWLADRASGIQRDRDYVVTPGQAGMSNAVDAFSYLTGDDRIPVRWFEFDTGKSVPWRVHDGGQPGLGTAATAAAFTVALQTWVNDRDSNVLYTYAGLTSASTGFLDVDGTNVILFDDPNGDDAADGTFECSSGGVIAVGGPWFDEDFTRTFLGKTYHQAVEADIVTNNGTDCFFADNSSVAEEVFAHELGHTLGLGHSRTPDALMRATVHNDGRGAHLSTDDQAGILSLYPIPDGGGGGGGQTAPKAPTGLTVTTRSGSEAFLAWTDASTNETGFKIERSVGSGAFQEVGTTAADVTSVLVTGLTPATAYTFQVRSVRSGKLSTPSNAVKVTTPAASPAPGCGGGAALCLADNRFRVEVDWRNQHNGNVRGKGTLTRVSDKTGTVWFFDPSAVDVIVKVLDGRTSNNRFWVFAGSLTDVEFWLKVTDTQTGAVRLYHNRPGDTRGLADTSAFAPNAAAATALTPIQEIRTLTPTAPAPTTEIPAAVSPSACVPGANALCFFDRFQVEVTWRNQNNGATGVGTVVPTGATASTGSFWFFDADNVELVLKVLDGRTSNGKFWIFYGSLSDVEYRVKVTDTQTGTVKVYHNKPGSLAGLTDTSAF